MKTRLALLSLIASALSLTVPYPYSIALSFTAAVLIFSSIGKIVAVIGAIISGIIVITPLTIEYAAVHIPWENFAESRGWMGNEMKWNGEAPRGFTHLNEEKFFNSTERLEIFGNRIKVVLLKDATMIRLKGDLYYKSNFTNLKVFSKHGGKIFSPPVGVVEIDGMNIDMEGFERSVKMELNGMENLVRLNVEGKFNIEVNGMNNSLNLKAQAFGLLEVSGLKNKVRVDLMNANSGSMRLEVNGIDNDVEIKIPRDGNIKIVKEVNPNFTNKVVIIRR